MQRNYTQKQRIAELEALRVEDASLLGSQRQRITELESGQKEWLRLKDTHIAELEELVAELEAEKRWNWWEVALWAVVIMLVPVMVQVLFGP